MSTPSKNKVLEAVLERVLPQQVPDAEVLSGRPAFQRAGLSHTGLPALPDIVAYSKHHNTLFFIQAGPTGAIDDQRLQELKGWSSQVTCLRAYVSVFASRKAYAGSAIEPSDNTYVWFADEPKHFLFLSGSPEASEKFISARMAQRASG